jgi:Ca2+:H+ antiporter
MQGMPRPSVYWLLLFVPVSVAIDLAVHQPLLVFVTSCLAILPLAAVLGRATDELAIRAGPRVGGLLNATFGNITELIISVLLVAAGEFTVVKASLIGSILGNLFLVMGASVLAGGLRFQEQEFSRRSAGVHASSLVLAVTALLMPALFVNTSPSTASQRLVISAVVAVVLILLYGAALLFTLVTHVHLFRVPQSDEQAEWSAVRAVIVLLVAAVVVGLEAELLVGSLDPTVHALGLSKIFVGLIVVAIVGNAAEHAAAVFFALRDKMDVSMEIAFGSSTQIALFVAPVLVFVSLLLGNPMDFVFTSLEVVAVALATVAVAALVLDGRSNWLEGAQLLGAYVIIGTTFFFVGGP